ncbi:MAG: amidohydrolase family protein [Promethearchaeota archaeon]
MSMRIIDAHVHVFDVKGYESKLLQVMDECGIEKSCISGLGSIIKCVNNKEILKIINKYPDRFIGAYFIRPGISSIREIKKAHEDGFRMLKVTLPLKPYNDETYLPYWEIAQELKMPVLFHTGVITTFKIAPNEKINSWYMHPMRLEPIANAFPDLKIILAHLGVHWNDDASELIRMRPNVYSDLSGAINGYRKRIDMIGLKHWLWWDGAFKKLIFGTDVLYKDIPKILDEDKKRLNKLGINKEIQQKIFSGNILKLLGEK